MVKNLYTSLPVTLYLVLLETLEYEYNLEYEYHLAL
jgi:hypothetical protein